MSSSEPPSGMVFRSLLIVHLWRVGHKIYWTINYNCGTIFCLIIFHRLTKLGKQRLIGHVRGNFNRRCSPFLFLLSFCVYSILKWFVNACNYFLMSLQFFVLPGNYNTYNSVKKISYLLLLSNQRFTVFFELHDIIADEQRK